LKRWLAFTPLIVLAALALLFAGYALKRDPKISPHAMVGKPMPVLTLPELSSGQPTALKDAAQSGPVLVNFFASWCAPCEIEHPQLMALKARGVTVIGVAYKDAPANTQAFLSRLGDPFAARLIDRDGRAGIEFGVTGVPETFVVAADGTVVAKHTGPLEAKDLDGLVAKLR
jgi:cytochrome c biogenesis protein CcmG/thiol:disulfide interchange protein DsbE